MVTDIENNEKENGIRSRKCNNSRLQTEPKTIHHDDTPPLNRMTTEMMAIQKQMQEFQLNLTNHINSSLADMVNGILEQIEQIQVHPPNSIGLTDESLKYKNRIKSGGSLSDKQFLARNSILSELFQLKHIRTIYNIFIVILIILFLNTAVHDVVTTGKLNLGFELIIWNFEKPHIMLLIWFAMMSSTVMLYISFFYWATWRIKFVCGSINRKCWEYCGFFGILTYELLLFYLPLYYICKYELRPGASFTLLMEQVRLIMKTHAFIRSNIPRALAYKAHNEDNKNSPCPGFSYFLYFMFAPTLVYRDNYPRTKEIRWDVVSYHFAEVVGVVFYIAFIFERFLIPMFRNFGIHPFKTDTVVMVIFGAMMPGTLAFLCGFFCLLHSWMNAFAEMLQFADRMFYKDWWNVTSYAAYYRTWNIVVHDWLYTYIYKDICETFRVKHHSVVTILVFFVSAVVHEYILSVTFKYFYPMLFVAFGGFGALLVFLPQNPAGRGNLIVWLLLCIGNGILTSAYSIEWYARINCVRTVDSFLDFFIPRSWNCQPAYIPQ